MCDSLHKDINFVYLKSSSFALHWNHFWSYGNEVPESVLQNIVWNGTAKKMMNYIDKGAFYTLFIGHGDRNSWLSLGMNKDSLDRLNNGSRYPVVFSMSCKTGDFFYDDCFAQHFCSLDAGTTIELGTTLTIENR